MGFGKTKIHGENTPDPVSFLRSFLKAMEISRCHLVGNSMGGMTVSKYAAEHPELVSSLTLSGGEPRIETSQVSTLGSLGATPRNDFVRKMFVVNGGLQFSLKELVKKMWLRIFWTNHHCGTKLPRHIK